MIVWTPTVFECLIRMYFLFLYFHLLSATEHVSHGKRSRNTLIIIIKLLLLLLLLLLHHASPQLYPECYQ